MSNWKPISLIELQKEIKRGINLMTQVQLESWNKISIKPMKWEESEFGDEGGGFWVVAIIGNEIIWYNDIEEGFNISDFKVEGKIEEYFAEQDIYINIITPKNSTVPFLVIDRKDIND